MAKTVVVHVQPWHVNLARHCAEERLGTRGRRDRPDYQNKALLQPEPNANLAACLCELAVSLEYDRRWNGPYWDMKYHRLASQLPDVGECIEVRRTRAIGNGVPVKETDAERNYWIVQAYVDDDTVIRILAGQQADAHVQIVGQVLAKVAWEHGKQRFPEKRLCPAGLLEPVSPCEVCVCFS
jgi:hypothetical protein